MRIVCDTVDDFLTNVNDCSIHQKTIYVNKALRSLTADPVRSSHSIEVTIQLSAVLLHDDESQALIECGQCLGIDRKTADGELCGTETFDKVLRDVYEFCDDRCLRIRPGVLGL
jgi:hypothetical protein